MTTSTFAAITGDFSAQLAPEHQAVATLLERIFVLMKIIGSHGTIHPSTHEMASAALSALRQCRLPSALQFVREAVFYDRTLVPLDIEGFKRGQSLSQAMNHCGVHEVSFESGVDETALIAFFEVLSKGLVGPNDLLEQMRLPGISWREIPGAGWGAEAKPIDPDLFAVTQVSLAVADTDLLADAFGQPWNWAAGVSILRRLERAVEVDARAADRAVELVPVPWSAGRRAVAMAVRVLAVERELGTEPATARASGHAALVLGCCGFRVAASGAFAEAATETFARLVQTSMASVSGAIRHRVRVCSLIQALAAPLATGQQRQGAVALLHLLYELEWRRHAEQGRVALTMADMLGAMMPEVGRAYPSNWFRALIGTLGELPAGSRVTLADGRVGIVLGPGSLPDPWLPQLLVGGQIVQPTHRVRLFAQLPGRTA